jgi:hypothetical protein
MRIVTLNCWGGRVYEPLLRYIREVDADVLCLQEMYASPPGVPSPLIFTYEYRPAEDPPVYPSLFADIQNALPGYQSFFYPAAQGYVHDGASTDYKVRYGIATFVRNSLAVIREGVDFVFDSYRDKAWGPPPLPRNAHCVRLWRDDVGKPIVIAHMHGLWLPNQKKDSSERVTQAAALA